MTGLNFWDWFNAITITVCVILWAIIVWKDKPTRKKFYYTYILYCDKHGTPELPPMRKFKGVGKWK